jgi:hypothetical protein
MAKPPEGCVLVQLCGDPIIDASIVGNALVDANVDLFNTDAGLRLLRDGELVIFGRDLVPGVVAAHVVIKDAEIRDGKVAAVYRPVVLDEMTLRALMTGRLPPKGGNMEREVRGGALADRVPRVSLAALRRPAPA